MAEQFLAEISHSLSKFIPEVVLSITLCAVIIFDLIFGRRFKHIGAVVSLLGLGIAAFFTIKQYGETFQIFRGMFVVDPFSVFFKFIFIISGALIIIFSMQSYELKETSAPEAIG